MMERKKRLSELETEYNLPPNLLYAVMMQESSGRDDAVGPKTKYGTAKGPFQFIDSTAKEYGVSDPFNFEQSAIGAAKKFQNLNKQYGGDLRKMLAAYNWGSGNIAKIGMENMPEETRNYLAKIIPQVQKQYASSDQIMTDVPVDQDVTTITITPKSEQSTPDEEKLLKQLNADIEKALMEQLNAEIEGALLEQPDKELYAKGKAAAKEPTFVDRQLNGLGMGARAIAEGGADILGVAYNPIAALQNWAFGTEVPTLKESVSGLLDRAGVYKPQTTWEKNLSKALEFAIPAGGVAKVAGKVADVAAKTATKAPIAKFLAEAPTAQTMGAALSGLASSATEQAGWSPVTQFLTSIAAGQIPYAIGATPVTMANLFNNWMRGDATPEQMQQVVDAFEKAGTAPTVSQVTGNKNVQGAETFLGRFYGTMSKMAKKAEEMQEGAGDFVKGLAEKIAPKSDAVKAGQAITQGGQKTLRSKRAIESSLYDKAAELLPPQTPIEISNTRNYLEAAIGNGDFAITDNLVLRKLYDDIVKLNTDSAAMASSLGAKNIDIAPYKDIKSVRTQIGYMLSNPFMTDVPTAQLKGLWGALSDDIKGAYAQQGDDALKAFNRANTYSRALHDRVAYIKKFFEKEGVAPEKIFEQATSQTTEGATAFRSLMKMLPKEEQKILVSAVLNKIGKARPGQQDDMGTAFSTERFLTDWNKLGAAKNVIADAMGAQYKQDMDKIAKMASTLRQGSRVYSNPSGTAGAEHSMNAMEKVLGVPTQLGLSVALPASMGFAGGIAPLAASGVVLLGTIYSSRKLANKLTDPQFVRWIASGMNHQTPSTWKNHLAKISTLNALDQTEKEELYQMLSPVQP